MVNSVIGVCDENTVYMKKLAGYFMQKSSIPLQIRSFSDWEQLIRYLQSNELDVLILGGVTFLEKWERWDDVQADKERYLYEEGMKEHVKWVIKLVDEVSGKELKEEKGNHNLKVSRYQPPAELLAAVEKLTEANSFNGNGRVNPRMIRENSFYEVNMERDIRIHERGGRVERRGINKGNFSQIHEENSEVYERNPQVIGIYSPLNRCGKTSLAVLFSEILARRGNSLMICMDHHNGILVDEELNIAELIYYLSREQQLVSRGEHFYDFSQYDRFVKKWEQILYIAASSSVENMMQIPPEPFCELIHLLQKRNRYQYIVLDLSEGIESLYKVLNQCDVIFMPVLNDCISKSKIQQFEQQMSIVMEQEAWESLKCRIYKIQLPETIEADGVENYYRELIWSDLGNFAGQILEQYGI